MTVAVFAALRAEIELLVASLTDARRADVAGWPVWSGNLAGVDTVLALAGMGKVNTAALSGVVWERYRPGLMVFTGVAGALDPTLQVGDIVIGERTIQHDCGVISPHGLQRYQAGHIPFFNPTDEWGFTPSHEVLAMARDAVATTAFTPVLDRLPAVSFRTIITGDQFLQDAITRDELFAELGAAAIEMEGAALAQAARQFGIDHLVIRSMSDLAGDESPEHFARFVPEVAANSARLVAALVANCEHRPSRA
ncbi:MAG TPA: 5'-methylthioadenosine/adenosylhomocysteine nucleosidase [Ilumatobacter sp.]|nr:5'-methylthioadenosine/adenosylhomocysteine nucleosidase [Ilumatobacter sp.]